MILLLILLLLGEIVILVVLIGQPSTHDIQNLQCEISNIKHRVLDENRKMIEAFMSHQHEKKHHHNEPCPPELDNIYLIKGLAQRLDNLEQVILCSIEKWGAKIMGTLQDEFQGLKQDIADERIEILAAIQKIIDNAGGDDDKITLAQIQELRSEIRGIYTETPTVPVPPVEPPVE